MGEAVTSVSIVRRDALCNTPESSVEVGEMKFRKM